MSDQASTIMVNTLEPQSGTTLTVGKSGQNLVVNADSLKANVAKDAGANALFTSDGSGNISGLNSGFGSAQVLISTQTADDSATLSFTSGITSTYKEYVFEFFEINPVTNNVRFLFQCSTDGGSNYNTTMTTTAYRAYHSEADATGLGYQTGADLAESTDYQPLAFDSIVNDADAGAAGELHLFNPASTTYVKNFYCRCVFMGNGPYVGDAYAAGFYNTTSAINAISFKVASGNFDGTIVMYGVV